MKTYVILVVAGLILCWFASKLIDFMTALRVKKGILNKIKILITDDETILFDQLNQELFIEPNIVLYKEGKQKAIRFGSNDKTNQIEIKIPKEVLQKNFIKEFDLVMNRINDFWYQYITYYVLKYKRLKKISSFVVVSTSIQVNVESKYQKEKIKQGIEIAKYIKKPRFYNILDIS